MLKHLPMIDNQSIIKSTVDMAFLFLNIAENSKVQVLLHEMKQNEIKLN
jgi:hypothetical protein